MPQEPYYEVMAYSRAMAQSVSVPAALVTNVGAAATGVLNSILTGLAGAQLDGLKDNITALLGRKMMVAYDLKYANIVNYPDAIELVLDEDYKIIIDRLKAGIVEGVGATHANLYETMAGTNSLAGGYTGIIQRVGVDPFISRWVNQSITPNIPDVETALFMLHIGALTVDQRNEYIAQNGWSQEFIPALEAAFLSAPPISVLLDFKRRGYVDDAFLTEWLRRYRFSGDMIDNIKKLSIQYPEPYRLAEMYTKGLLLHDDYISTMGKFGIEYPYAVAWAGAQLQFPTFDQCMMMYRRGILDVEDFKLYMQFQQFGEFQVNQMLGLKDVIPPIQDLIRFAVREAYLDHDPEKQYSEMVNIAGKMGLTAQASEWYWYAHWDRIPVNLMYANYHRGLWNVEKLMRMLKIVDVHPDDRQDIINVAYGPPSIREMGYGFDVGVYTEEDIVKYRRWGGLSPEDATKSGRAMVAYRTEAERNALRIEYMYAFGRGAIDEAFLREALTQLHTQSEVANLWMTRAALYRERMKKPLMDVEGRIVSSSEALTAFKLGLRDETWTRAKLKDLSWAQDRIDVAIERAKLEIEQDKTKVEEVKYRKLTIAQITNLYGLGLITRDEMTTEFVFVGYNPDDAALLTEVYTAPKAPTVAVKNYTITDTLKLFRYQIFDETDIYNEYLLDGYDNVHASMLTLMTKLDYDYPILANLYEKGYINLEQIMAELKKIGLDEYHSKLLIDRTMYTYQVSRLATEKDLTKAEILKGAKNNVFTTTQAVGLLEGIGYDENEAYYLLAINKIVVAGDPDGYWDMRKVTEQYKKARGEKYVDVPDELIMLEKSLKEAQAKVNELKKQPEKEEEIKNAVLSLSTIEQRMRELISKLGLK